MKWFIEVVTKNYANFEGRATRQEYWMFYLFYVLFSIATVVADIVLGLGFLNVIYLLALFLPTIGVTIRRLHDIGKSGWWNFIVLIPLVGVIWFLVLLCTDSQPSENEYGM
jgi:uncharacterized membrane protein YhaH (DUF805 family)